MEDINVPSEIRVMTQLIGVLKAHDLSTEESFRIAVNLAIQIVAFECGCDEEKALIEVKARINSAGAVLASTRPATTS